MSKTVAKFCTGTKTVSFVFTVFIEQVNEYKKKAKKYVYEQNELAEIESVAGGSGDA
jgi:hypothetical protein